MDPFTQRMLERARARQEKIDQKLASSGQAVPKRKPLSENISVLKNENSPVKSPIKSAKDSVISPRKSIKESNVKSPRRSTQKSDNILSPAKSRNEVVVTTREFKSPRASRGSTGRRNSDVSVEINITHRDNIQIEVQVEERDAPLGIVYDTNSDSGSSVTIKEIDEDSSRPLEKKYLKQIDMKEDDNEVDKWDSKSERAPMRHNMKSRLDRLGNLYSDKPTLSSPIHRTEADFSAGTPPSKAPSAPRAKADGKKFGRLAALADQINNWEDDLSHHNFQHPEPPAKKGFTKSALKSEHLDLSTLDVSIHSLKDINQVLQTNTPKASQSSRTSNSRTFNRPAPAHQQLDRKIVSELEDDGYRRVSAGQSRLVYDFTTTKTSDRARQEPKLASNTPSAAAAPNMATMVANPPTVAKKPSIKKYKAPTPPRKVDNDCDSDKDKENNAVPDNGQEDDNIECKQKKPVEEAPASPVVKRIAPKLNGNADRNSVLSKAAMFESGSPRAKEKDPAEMSLRERKALFEKNKGAVIMPKAPFGLAPSAKSLAGDKAKPVQKPATPTKPVLQKTDSKDEDNISLSSLGGGIKEKLAALMNKEQTISEATIANKISQEREKEMEMLQNRFHLKPSTDKPQNTNNEDSDDDNSDHDPSENAPLMGSTLSLTQANKRPEIISNVPKVVEQKEKQRKEDKVVGTQPNKRRSSQDSPVVLSVLDDVKRIKVNGKKDTNGAVLTQPTSLYPHLSDIETDTSRNQDEFTECGGSSSDNITDKLNKSENWADTSFGREVMNVVKKNRKSYKKAVRASYSSESDDCDSDLDACIDEALEEETSEGPTPPKQNKHGLSSTSFVYKEKAQFKSPQKPPAPVTPATPVSRDKGSELVHSVSFYRRMQNASSTPSTPLRVIRHHSPERAIPPTPDEPAVSVTTVRQRIKELQQEISKQQTVISQASQALNLCAATIEFSGSTEQAEGERLLLLATHRRQACLHEVQRLQVEGAGPAAAPPMASLHIHALTVPLRRDYMRQLNADGATGHHAVCLLKCRDRVLATSMQLTQPNAHTLHFPDDIRMDGLSSDFKVTVEVYLLPASKEFLPHDVKYHISNKKSSSKLLTPKSKVSELKTPRVQSPAGPGAVRSTHFQLHGYCIFALNQASRKAFTLSKVPCGSPLEGCISIEIKARVVVPPPAPHAAFLTAFDDVSGLGAWHRRWFRLTPPRLQYWKYPDDVSKKMPIGDIDLSSVVSERVCRAPRDLCARPNTLLMESAVPPGLIIPDSGSLVYVKRADGSVVRRHLLAADTPKDRDVWLDCLNSALEYVRCCTQEDD